MADPITLAATVGMGASLAGGVVDGMGAKFAGDAKHGAYTYQAGVHRQSAAFNRSNASNTLESGTLEGIQLGLKQKQQMGEIIAAKGASGLDVNSGTNVDVVKSQEGLNRMDQELLQRNVARKAYAYEVAASGDEAQAVQYDVAARNAKKEGKIGVLKSIISTAASVSGKWMQGSQAGAF